MLPVVIHERPVSHIGVSDWYSKLWQNHQTNDARRKDSFDLRQESRQLQNDTRISTQWNFVRNNDKLRDRIIEVDVWKQTLEFYLDRVSKEQNDLKDEKLRSERFLDFLGTPVSTVKECISIRDGRRKGEITLDNVEEELKKELDLVEKSKFNLTERCKEAWDKINDLQDVILKLRKDITDKHEALSIDRDQFELTENSSVVTFKTDPTRVDKNSVTPEVWSNNCKQNKLLAEEEMEASFKLRKVLFSTREQIKNNILAQRDHVEFLLRRRIFDTQKVRNEIAWQQIKMDDEMKKLAEEIKQLQEALDQKSNPRKLVETRLENRYYRPQIELVSDEPEEGLQDELIQLKNSIKNLTIKLAEAKTTYNALEYQKYLIDKDLEDKNNSLDVDLQCLNARKPLRMERYFGPEENTERNVQLVKVDAEIPPSHHTHI